MKSSLNWVIINVFIFISCDREIIGEIDLKSNNAQVIAKDTLKSTTEKKDSLYVINSISGINFNIEIVAHRGASAYEPENSLLSFKRAFELGADAIELDLWFSKDDSLMVFHDINTKRMSGVNLNIPETNYKDLRTLTIGKGEKIPTLSEVLDILPSNKRIYLDLKWIFYKYDNIFLLDDIFLKELYKSKRVQDCILTSFSAIHLRDLKIKDSKLKYLLINDNYQFSEIVKFVDLYNLEGINSSRISINHTLNNYLKNKGKKHYVWSIDNEKDAINLYLDYSINGVFTTKPDVIRSGFENF